MGCLMNNPTQCQEILRYIKEKGSISSYEAYTELYITQLGARLRNLEDRGYIFRRERVHKKNRYGRPVSFCNYFLEREGERI